jgi:hypothetical protein
MSSGDRPSKSISSVAHQEVQQSTCERPVSKHPLSSQGRKWNGVSEIYVGGGCVSSLFIAISAAPFDLANFGESGMSRLIGAAAMRVAAVPATVGI